MKTIILNISDIHYGSQKSENEGLVLSSFLKDVEEQIQLIPHEDIFVFIGGDLVFAASKNSYEGFDRDIIQELMRVLNIDRSHFIIVPGNHDLKQSFISDVEESFMPIFNAKYDEDKFNSLIRKTAQVNTLFGKFESFEYFVKDIMKNDDYSMQGGFYNLNNSWSVYTINTAILSCGGYNNIDDIGKLGVDTRSIHEYLKLDKHKHKILLMHHPEEFCMDWVKTELRKLYNSDFDLILSGHTHDQDLYCQDKKENGYIHCSAPQLFTDKHDEVLGYCFVEFNDQEVTRITYREWFEKRNKFRVGLSFTDEETGIVSFEHKSETLDRKQNNTILAMMEMKLREAMEAFVGQPYIWVERYLSDDRIDQIFKMTKSTLFSEIDIINNNENIRIVAPSQYGLTCYGLHFLQTLWQTKNEFAIMINADSVHSRKFERMVESEISLYQKEKADVKWIVIDNWRPYKKDQQGISNYLMQQFPNTHVLLLSPFHEHNFCEHENAKQILKVDKTLYLTPLKHEQERLIVDEYNKDKYIEESDIVLGKIDADIKDFNLHRTPYSCITLLTVFKDSFDRNPVNRTSVLENVLNIIFDNTKLPTYKDSNPDIKDCEFCLGYFCSQIIENEYFLFTRETFYSKIKEFCDIKQTSINILQLFDILCYNKIIVEDNSQYTFRFTFWVYYFVASWMHVDDSYAKKMLSNQHYQQYPEVLEFYTGKDRKRFDAVKAVTEDIKQASNMVQQKIGIPNSNNPFAFLRFKNNREQTDKIIKEIDANIQSSNLPQDIKDQVADLTFNPSAAFNQDISKIYSDFSVGYLVNIISIASKVLRNSDHLDAKDKQELLSEITTALKVFSNIIYLVSHLFAKQGYIHLPEYSLKLTDSFNQFEEAEKRIQIIVSIPYNLMLMFKEDLYSRKLSPVYIDQLKRETDKAKKHLLAALIVYKQPEGWEPAIKEYINNIGKDSYYLGTITELMEDEYYIGDLDSSDRGRMSSLIKAALYKADHGILPPSLALIKDVRLKSKNDISEIFDSSHEKE